MNLKFVFMFVLYLAIFICGFIITIALGITKSNFDGNCPLYMETIWHDLMTFQIKDFGRESTCDYVIYLPLITCILFPLIMLLLLGYIIFHIFLGNTAEEKRIKPIPLLIVNSVSFVLIFIAACIVSTGRGQMCSSITDFRTTHGQPEISCYEGERIEWHHPRFRTATFVRDVILGEVTLWISLIWWLLLIIPEILGLWRRRGLNAAPTAENETTMKA